MKQTRTLLYRLAIFFAALLLFATPVRAADPDRISSFDGATGWYHAIQVVTVMRPETGSAMNVVVTQDGKPIPKDDAGTDVEYDGHGNSYVVVNQPRAYDLVMNKHFGTHEIRLFPQTRDLALYSFAFESCEVGSDT